MKGKKIAAHLLEASEQDIQFEAGVFSVAGTDRTKTFQEIAGAAYVPQIIRWRCWSPGWRSRPITTRSISPIPADVTSPSRNRSRDRIVTLEKYTAVDDVGTVINPMIVEGQLHGGIVQGIGQALYENASMTSLRAAPVRVAHGLLHAARRSSAEHDRQTHSTLCTHTPMGVKGCGEVGTIGSPAAVINAVVDALSHLGVQHVDMPATPNRIWRVIHNAAMPRAAE